MMSGKPLKYAVAALAAAGLVAAAGLTGVAGASATVSSPVQVTGHPAAAGGGHRYLPDPYEFLPRVPSFRLTSASVKNGHPLPLAQLSGILGVPGGKDISPQLSWSGFPRRAKSFVVSMYDPEAPTGSGFWHWVVVNIPARTTSLHRGAGALHGKFLPAGAFQLDADYGVARYIGGAPPRGSGIHDYYITVTALDEASTGVTAATSPALLGFLIDSHTIARATIICPTAAPPAP